MESVGILSKYTATLIHDFWRPYLAYSCDHAYCNAHLSRELQGIYDGFKQEWAKHMKILLEEMHHYTFVEKKCNEHQIQEFCERYDGLIIQGELANPPPQKQEGKRGKPKKTKGGNLVERMKEHKDEILGFLTTGGKIPFTNNQAERDIRMVKVKQKIAGCFRTWEGAR